MRKGKAHLELKLGRDRKGDQKGSCKYTGTKRKAEENVCLKLHGEGDQVTNGMEKVEVLCNITLPK